MGWGGIWRQTEREKQGMVNAINLFFGALLGANLGTLDAMPLGGYALIVLLLAGAVGAIQVALHSERRLYAAATLGAYALLLGLMLAFPTRIIDGLALDDMQRIIVTLIVWLGMAIVTELVPVGSVAANEGEQP